MKLPSVYPLTIPSSHRMIRMIAMVSSMCLRLLLHALRGLGSTRRSATWVPRWNPNVFAIAAHGPAWEQSRAHLTAQRLGKTEKCFGVGTPGLGNPGLVFRQVRGVADHAGHGAVDDDLSVDAGKSFEHAHPPTQALDACFDLDHVAREDRAAETDFLDAREEDQLAAILGLRQDQDSADLRDALGEDGRRQRRTPARVRPEKAFVQRNVLDADDPLVGFHLRDAIDEEKRIPVRENTFDGAVVQRRDQGFHLEAFSIIRSNS